MSEKNIQSEIMLALSQSGALVWRNQVGTFRALDNPNRIVSIGQNGQPDLMAVTPLYITPEMVGSTIGAFVGIEVKSKTGKQKHDQKLWQLALEKRYGKYAVCRTTDDAMEFIKKLN